MTIRLLPRDRLERILPLLEQVHALHCAAQPHRYQTFSNPDAVLDWLNDWATNQNVHVLISGPTNAPTGYLAYVIITKPASIIRPAQHFAVLEHICVDAPHRGKGIARALIAEMRSHLRTEKVTHMRATHAPWNTASAALLKSEGFEASAISVEAPVR